MSPAGEYAVWAWCITDLENPHGILSLDGVGYHELAGRGKEASLPRLANLLTNDRFQRFVYWLKLSLQNVGQGFSLLGFRESETPRCDQGR